MPDRLQSSLFSRFQLQIFLDFNRSISDILTLFQQYPDNAQTVWY